MKSGGPNFRPWSAAGKTGFAAGWVFAAGADNVQVHEEFVADESGVTAIEYALIASLIAVFIITAVQTVGTKVSTVFTEIGNTLK